ncbi:unnamed protein product [Notodromas monacha]|uniref:Uncharacterized protein n=1 Tax=Notodromas monacha TaxID=399045 RepID=A0A7R9BSF1_9CRUS|nr:unnamed protein product [Notodromas monacha]CAG0919788.1 unnamed protein product [Notodromas monacha]
MKQCEDGSNIYMLAFSRYFQAAERKQHLMHPEEHLQGPWQQLGSAVSAISLSLYDNDLKSLAPGTFDPLRNIKTLRGFISRDYAKYALIGSSRLFSSTVELCDFRKNLLAYPWENLLLVQKQMKTDVLSTTDGKSTDQCLDPLVFLCGYCFSMAKDSGARIKIKFSDLFCSGSDGELRQLIGVILQQQKSRREQSASLTRLIDDAALPKRSYRGLWRIASLSPNVQRMRSPECLERFQWLCLEVNLDASSDLPGIASAFISILKILARAANNSDLDDLHLARNPWMCDCNLEYVAEYLMRNPTLETSGVRCEGPPRMSKKKIAGLSPDKFYCIGSEGKHAQVAGQCFQEQFCPKVCRCEGTTVNCSGKALTSVPNDVPSYATQLDLSENKITELPAASFQNLPHLQVLDLSKNSLGAIAEGVLAPATKLVKLRISKNPFRCNCHLAWLAEWLRKRDVTEDRPTCHEPYRLRTKPLIQMHSSDFKCTSDDDVGCVGAGHCPRGCQCEGTVVRCSRSKLQEIPKDIPQETTELDLSNNKISVLGNNTFGNLTRLETLIISYNKLECIHSNSLAGLHALRILSLHGNDISRIPEGTFGDLRSITHLALGSNPLYCDCDLLWLSDWVKRDYVEPGIAKCQDPPAMRNKLILTSPSDSFICKGSVEPEILAKCDACYKFPCRNGATCHSIPLKKYVCECSPGFHGDHCEYEIDACYGNPCENSGTCKVLEAAVTVLRVSLAIGANITWMTAWVTSAPIIPRVWMESAHTRNYCEKKIPFCTEEFNPCKNGGNCVDHFTHYTCECPQGFLGENCTVNIDDCEDHLCMNGGTCVDGVNEYTCKCPTGFWGKFCEGTPVAEMLYPQTSPCQHHDCKNGICFQPKADSSDYKCEFLTAVSFADKESFVELPGLQVRPAANVTIFFRTTQQEGVLLYLGQNQHWAVELFTGRIRVSYDVGNYPLSNMFSYEKVADGTVHRIELLAVKQNFTLKVDSGLARTIINNGEKEYLDVNVPLYIGGVPPEIGRKATASFHLRNATSLNEGLNK